MPCNPIQHRTQLHRFDLQSPGKAWRRRYEKVADGLAGVYSRCINIHHRFVSQILEEEQIVKVPRGWSYYA